MLLHEKNDSEFQREALREAEAIIRSAIKHDQMGHEVKGCLPKALQTGYCVLCRREIAFDLEKRLCLDCREELEEWQKPIYTEYYCHCCGKPYVPQS
ncbi:MAG: hypothetical protein HY730_01335 [Candidatus Tectomicrobia bacterium]|uniref:Uncharacterized protein n=1 Tax=Tectimicrobiota bacterium TaxID=2528274 RepID=A0A933LPF1_UNCTE|nr:hypothetical protein [Candidatus Tectomicrobia bacterium]